MKAIYAILICLLCVLPHSAFPFSGAEETLLRTKAHDPEWLALLNYDAKTGRSDVVDRRYFLSPQGDRDPLAELKAFLQQSKEATLAPDMRPACRFPARAIWIAQNLPGSFTPPRACPAFDTWKSDTAIDGATLIFVAGSYKNPASYYGHVLLRLTRSADTSNLLDKSLNYGAVVPDNENGVVYVIRGLFGAYDSRFTEIDYYRHRKDYIHSQQRDMWEYRLNLPQRDVTFLAAHVYELQTAVHKYYFVSKNCAYRFAELIQLVVADKIDFYGKPWSTPVDLFAILAEAKNRDGAPVVAKISRIPSSDSAYRLGYARLTPEQRRALRNMVRHGDFDTGLSVKDDTQVLEVALAYVESAKSRVKKGNKKLNRRFADLETQLLVRRSLAPEGSTGILAPQQDRPPQDAQRSSLFQTNFIYSSELGTGIELRFRPAYRDLLSLDYDGSYFSNLSMADVRVALLDGKLVLRSFDAVNLFSLARPVAGLPKESGLSWRVRVGAANPSLTRIEVVDPLVELGAGAAVNLGRDGAAYLLGELHFEGDGFKPQAGVRLGAVWKAPAGTQAMADAYLGVFDDGRQRVRGEAVVRFLGTPTRDYRLGVRYEEGDEIATTTEAVASASFHF